MNLWSLSKRSLAPCILRGEAFLLFAGIKRFPGSEIAHVCRQGIADFISAGSRPLV